VSFFFTLIPKDDSVDTPKRITRCKRLDTMKQPMHNRFLARDYSQARPVLRPNYLRNLVLLPSKVAGSSRQNGCISGTLGIGGNTPVALFPRRPAPRK
jgi:hypothetical protein